LFKIFITRVQCSDWTKKNSMTTTLPFSAEREVVLPEGSEMVKSGDLRGNSEGAATSAGTARTIIRIAAVSFCMISSWILSGTERRI
jgi:hypothetical protein